MFHEITLYSVNLDLIENILNFKIVFKAKKYLLAKLILFWIFLWLLPGEFISTIKYLQFYTISNSMSFTFMLKSLVFFRDTSIIM